MISLILCQSRRESTDMRSMSSPDSSMILAERSSCEEQGTSRLRPPATQISPLMSSTTTSSPNFQYILDAALESYAKQTGIDLTKHPSADKLQDCRSPDDVLQILSERESAFKDYRDRYRNIINHVRPVVQVVHAFSALLGDAAGLVSSGIQFTLSDRIFMRSEERRVGKECRSRWSP